MAKTSIQIERYECDGCGQVVDGDVNGQLASGLHFTVTRVDGLGNQEKADGFACRLSHLKGAAESALKNGDDVAP